MIKRFKVWERKKSLIQKDPVIPKFFTFSEEHIRISLKDDEPSLDLEEDNSYKASLCCLGNNPEQQCCVIS